MNAGRWLRVAGCVLAVCAGAARGQEAADEEQGRGDGGPHYPAGLLSARSTNSEQRLLLPLKQTDVHIEVMAGVTLATVTQRFVNDTPHALEAIYVFPLPAGATVTDMILRVGPRTIRSVVKEREEARQTYEAAKAEGRKAALVEEDRPNVFTTAVANFQPGETAEVILSYMEAADYRRGHYRVAFPMVVGPRYVPGGGATTGATDVAGLAPRRDAAVAGAPQLPPGLDPGYRCAIDVAIHGLPVAAVTSVTHAILAAPRDDDADTWDVGLAEPLAVPDCDFELDVALRDADEPEASLLVSALPDGAYALLTLLPPPRPSAAGPGPLPRDVIFVIDTSGSMDGSSIEQAKAGLRECLGMLTASDRVGIVRFSDTFSWFGDGALAEAKPDRLAAAAQYVEALHAEGGTEMLPALTAALATDARPESMKIVVFLTDGCVSNEEDLLRTLREQLGRARLFTFGIGSAPNEYLMREMAQAGRGDCRFIRDGEHVGEAVAGLFRTLESPVMTDVEVFWHEASGAGVDSAEVYPRPCPDVFMDRPVQLVGRLPYPFRGDVTVSGWVDGRRVSYTCDIDTDAAERFPAIESLFGQARLRHLGMLRRHASEADRAQALRGEMIQTALAFQLVSEFTSRVAVEEVVRKQADGALVTVNVPAVPPRGSAAGYVATATDDPLRLGVGLLLMGLGVAGFRWRAAASGRECRVRRRP